RHNSLVSRLKKAAAGKFEVVSENQALGAQRLRNDLILRRGTTSLIIDATVPFDNRMKAFEGAVAEKKAKFEELRKEIAIDHPGEVTVFPFIVCSLGSRDPANDELVKQQCSRANAISNSIKLLIDTLSIGRPVESLNIEFRELVINFWQQRVCFIVWR
ncbi:reverse transcriptase, putative, partial [Candidatus Regiella insecticola 5.15]